MWGSGVIISSNDTTRWKYGARTLLAWVHLDTLQYQRRFLLLQPVVGKHILKVCCRKEVLDMNIGIHMGCRGKLQSPS